VFGNVGIVSTYCSEIPYYLFIIIIEKRCCCFFSVVVVVERFSALSSPLACGSVKGNVCMYDCRMGGLLIHLWQTYKCTAPSVYVGFSM
jgi:hypothetical protein